MEGLLIGTLLVLVGLAFWYVFIYPGTEMAHRARQKEWERKTAPKKKTNLHNSDTWGRE